MTDSMYVGVDVGGTKTAVSLSRVPPAILWRTEFPTLPGLGPKPALDKIFREISRGLEIQGAGAEAIASIGVSCGGPLDTDAGVVLSPPNLETWTDVPITRLLEDRFGATCFLENDANAGALAEFYFGAGRGAQNLIFLTMGTGLGAGLILNGQLYRGSNNAAGEIGHVRLTSRGPVGYGKGGSAEGWASGGGMARVAALKLAEAHTDYPKTLLEGADLSARKVWDAARAGDRLALEVIETCGSRLGEAIAILVDILNPDRVIVGGLALRMGDAILDPARRAVNREALATNAAGCEIVAAELGERLGDVAALCVAVHSRMRSSEPANAL